jgi:hypothetical protein
MAGEPLAKCGGLLFAKRTERHVHVPVGDVDAAHACGVSSIARDIAGALSVANNPKAVWPALIHASLTRWRRLGSYDALEMPVAATQRLLNVNHLPWSSIP